MYQVYKTIDGDSFDSLAIRFDVSSDELIRINGFNDFNIGDMIVVPNNDMYFSYFTKSGDTMYSIADKYNQDLDILYLINGIKEGDYIYPNQEILIPRNDVSVYLTRDDDTLGSISSAIGVSVSDIIRYNSDLVLMPEQIIVYRRD